MTSESFVGTDSLRDRLGRSLITTTALSTAGKKRYSSHCNSAVYDWPTTVEPLYNEVLGITNDILRPSNSKIHGKVPRYNETSF